MSNYKKIAKQNCNSMRIAPQLHNMQIPYGHHEINGHLSIKYILMGLRKVLKLRALVSPLGKTG